MTKKKKDTEQEQTLEEKQEKAAQEEQKEELTTQEKLEAELEKAQAQAAEYLDGWQRTQAEFSNYKKRQETERAQMITLANAGLLRKLLPVVDDFERALATLPSHLEQLTWSEGILIIKRKLDAIIESEGVKPIETAGQTFDPRYHEAVTHEEAPGYQEDQIIGEVQKGYTLGERILRPALVRVAKAPPAQSEQNQDDDTIEDKE